MVTALERDLKSCFSATGSLCRQVSWSLQARNRDDYATSLPSKCFEEMSYVLSRLRSFLCNTGNRGGLGSLFHQNLGIKE